MCLMTYNATLYVAKTDIEGYKLVYVDLDGSIVGPNMFNKIPDECLNGKIPYVAKGKPEPKQANEQQFYATCMPYAFGEGLIHIYSPSELSRQLRMVDIENFMLYRCVIKKGTKYVSGVSTVGRKSYAAESIEFREIVFDGGEYKKMQKENFVKRWMFLTKERIRLRRYCKSHI